MCRPVGEVDIMGGANSTLCLQNFGSLDDGDEDALDFDMFSHSNKL